MTDMGSSSGMLDTYVKKEWEKIVKNHML
jgi:hypothetical protein